MTRLAGTTVYALIAALVLVTPLSASEDTAPETVPGATPPAEPTPPETAPPEAAAPPEASAPPEPAPAAEPVPAPAPTAPPPPAPAASVEPAAAAPVEPEPRRSRGRRPEAAAAASTTVTIRDFEFAPASVTIDVGDTVTWVNDGPTSHSATAADGSFDTGVYRAGQSRSHTFDQAGTFSYFCTPHPNMRGTVSVRAASGGGTGGGTSGGDTGSDSGSGDAGAGSAAGGAALPATGLDAGGLAVLGLMTVVLGAWLRRRASAAG